jgi:enoyl-CoA hydratase
MTTEVLIDISDGVQTITINRPEARNAMTLAAAKAIAAALDELDNRDDLRIGILTGASGFGGLTRKPPRKPMIAAVEGYALAGGFELVLACDLVVASESAQFGLPEVKRGLAATAGGLVRLPRQLPYRIALELALTGDFFPAKRAYEYGLINRLVNTGQALAEARKLAQTIAANGPLSVAASKRVISESQDWSAAEAWEKQASLTDHVFTSADAREGSAAFAEKRKPNWLEK